MTAKSYMQIQLETVPERALPFLRAIATNQQIRFAMAGGGYGEAEQAEGWRLLLGATGYAAQKLSLDADAEARQAITEIDNWDESGYRRIHAALERMHPEQDAFVFAGLEASRGPSAVLGVAKLLDRLDQLQKGTAAERAAIATLEKRGINSQMRTHLRSLVTVAQAAKPVEQSPVPTTPDTQQQALEPLYAWYRDWSETARALIHRRDHLILMGLAKRRSHKDDDPTDDPNPEQPVAAPSGHTPTESTSGTSAAPTNTNATPTGTSSTSVAH
jgi:hypothetical protein